MGGRLLRRRLLAPELDAAEIGARLDAVEELVSKTIARAEIHKTLEGVLDLERLLARVSLGTATPRDLLALGRSLAAVPALKQQAVGVEAARLRELAGRLDEVAEVRDAILAGIADHPPVNLADGGVIRDGYHAELDELRDIRRNSRQYIASIEARERARTGIGSLKVRFNNVFGYYIEISKANLHLAPPDYERKQTLVNAERFITPELKELEAKVLEAEERILELERELFHGLRSLAAQQASRIRETAAAIREQGGLVVIPHPYDRMRRSTLKSSALQEALELADAVEVFNSRTVVSRYNVEAVRIASRLGLPGTAGSDAHLAVELGAAWVEVPLFCDAQDFLAKLSVATWRGRRGPLWVHVATKAVRRGRSLSCRTTD